MIDTFIIGGYWGSRAEPLNHVARKILQTLKKLSDLDDQFLNWYEKGMSKKQALEKKVLLDIVNIERICRKEVEKDEIDENGFAKNGFINGFWTGHKENESSAISFTVGDKFSTTSLSNCCVINIPAEGDVHARLLQLNKVKAVMTILIDEWNPDYAVLTSNNLRDKLEVGNKIGWVTYKKELPNMPKLYNKIIHEKFHAGHLFYLNTDSDQISDYSMLNELKVLKTLDQKSNLLRKWRFS